VPGRKRIIVRRQLKKVSVEFCCQHSTGCF